MSRPGDNQSEMSQDRFNALLEAARAGSEQAWAEIFEWLAPLVLGYLRANRAPEPEDTLSEAFLQAARDLQRFEGDARRFRAWLFSIAHNRLIDARRAAARRPVEPVAEPPEPVVVADAAADEALARIDREEVHRVLDRLSPDQRAVLLLRVLGELTVGEAAEALGKRPGAIKALQRRGLAAVRRELAKEGVTLRPAATLSRTR
jgi:RNA polymerase sigma factor (sigma-70 family)